MTVRGALETWLKHSGASSCIVAVSGGRDSMCLLDSVRSLSEKPFQVLHVNHGVRENDSLIDESLVREYCDHHEIECSVERVDVPARMQQQSEGLETAARQLRLAAYARVAEQSGVRNVLVAHHANDQVETVLHNLMRGSAGLSGMQARKEMSQYGIVLHRPLLHVTREDIDHYVRAYDVPYRDDVSNQSDFTVRNRIRSQLIPLMQNVMGRDVLAPICRSSELEAEKSNAVVSYLRGLQIHDPQGRIYLPKLRELDPAFQREVLRMYLIEHSVSSLSRAMVERCMQLLEKEDIAKVNLSSNLVMRRSQQRLFIEA